MRMAVVSRLARASGIEFARYRTIANIHRSPTTLEQLARLLLADWRERRALSSHGTEPS